MYKTYRHFCCEYVAMCVFPSSAAGPVRCSGRLWCTVHSSSDAVVAQAYFHYSPDSGLCVQVAADCLPASNCSFSSVDGCHSVCGEGRSTIGGCGSTKYGCCVDGVTVREEGNCPGEHTK